MTKERAMEILDCNHREHYDNIDTIDEACEIGRQAIAKQIKRKLDYEADGYDEKGALIYDIAYCPVCNHEFEYEINDWGSAYCSDCGQALDWNIESE